MPFGSRPAPPRPPWLQSGPPGDRLPDTGLFSSEREDCRDPAPGASKLLKREVKVRLGDVGATAAVERIVRDTAEKMSRE
jgi:hypothetical protein